MHMHIAKAGKNRIVGREKTGKSGVAALEEESGCRGLIIRIDCVGQGHTGYLHKEKSLASRQDRHVPGQTPTRAVHFLLPISLNRLKIVFIIPMGLCLVNVHF